MKGPLVSVIIPNYNYARYLPERLESVLGQTFRDFEVIILDDCSTDSSRDVIGRYAGDPRVSHVVFNEANSGNPFVQWEKGIGLARGKYVWIAEADDVADPAFLEHTVAAMEADDDVTIVKTMSRLIGADGEVLSYNHLEDSAEDGTTAVYDGDSFLKNEGMLDGNLCYNASMVLFRKSKWSAFTSKPYLSMRYVGDWLFWAMVMNGGKIAWVKKQLNSFRQHSVSVIGRAKQKKDSFACEREMIRIYFMLMVGRSDKARHRYDSYQLLKYLKRNGSGELVARLDDDGRRCLAHIESSRRSYPWLWFYKHMIWPLKHQ